MHGDRTVPGIPSCADAWASAGPPHGGASQRRATSLERPPRPPVRPNVSQGRIPGHEATVSLALQTARHGSSAGARQHPIRAMSCLASMPSAILPACAWSAVWAATPAQGGAAHDAEPEVSGRRVGPRPVQMKRRADGVLRAVRAPIKAIRALCTSPGQVLRKPRHAMLRESSRLGRCGGTRGFSVPPPEPVSPGSPLGHGSTRTACCVTVNMLGSAVGRRRRCGHAPSSALGPSARWEICCSRR
jgi:hypothetical protein